MSHDNHLHKQEEEKDEVIRLDQMKLPFLQIKKWLNTGNFIRSNLIQNGKRTHRRVGILFRNTSRNNRKNLGSYSFPL